MPQVKPERTGWRDEALSRRHRYWGFDVPAIDIDFLMLEYDRGRPVALIEYKRETAGALRLEEMQEHSSYQALMRLADRLPVFVVRYAADLAWFDVAPLNSAAFRQVPGLTHWSEAEYVRFLYRLRGRTIAGPVLAWLTQFAGQWPDSTREQA